MTGDPQRPLLHVPLSAAASAPAAHRHETVLPDEPPDATADLAGAMAARNPIAVRAVCGRRPEFLEAWARLGEATLALGDAVGAYACARVAYHRGLDRLRRHGWGGTGMVRWARPSNRGFLRGLHLLMICAAALGELDESERCRGFLLELDPDDPLGIAAYPDVPGPDFAPPALPET